MGLFNKNKIDFYKEYKISEKIVKESTINHISKGKIPIETGIYNKGLISILDIDVSVNIMKNWEWRFDKHFIPIIATAFGDLFMYSPRSENCYFFQTQYNTLDLITDSIDELLNKALLDNEIKSYILKPWIMLGGKDIIENYSIGSLSVYLDLVSQSLEK